MSDEGMSDDGPCTDCDDTGITYQTERVCSCLAGLAIEMIDADACPTPIDRITPLEAQLLAAERERDALREALQRYGQCDYSCASNTILTSLPPKRPPCNCGYRAALTANHSAPVEEE